MSSHKPGLSSPLLSSISLTARFRVECEAAHVMVNFGKRLLLPLIGVVLSVTLLLLAGSLNPAEGGPVQRAVGDLSPSFTVSLPIILNNYEAPSLLFCRFGIGVSGDIEQYDVTPLRIGWYVDWGATQNPARPGGMEYWPVVRLEQTGPDEYSYRPSGAALEAVVASNPGAIWLIGNEPDRRRWQDDVEPHVYAKAYHELYHLIKSLDPSAKVAVGGIVQPTPLRLQYLDMVLDAYQTYYGEKLPTDLWNIHNFILREEAGNWGAGIPPGITVTQGMLYELWEHDDIEIFKEQIFAFRRWMKEHGEQDKALIVSEYGVLMPKWLCDGDESQYDPYCGYKPNGKPNGRPFSEERVKAFMTATFDFFLTATDLELGYPADGYRLVQGWAWYSLNDKNFNGNLFDPYTLQMTAYGDQFAAYTQALTPTVNLIAVRAWAEPVISGGKLVTATLWAQISNAGNIPVRVPITVAFYDGPPDEPSSSIIGSPQLITGTLKGCGDYREVTVKWAGLTTGTYSFFVKVEPVPGEEEADNIAQGMVLVGEYKVFLPLIVKQ